MRNIKEAVARAASKSKATRPGTRSLVAEVDEHLEVILAARAAGTAMKAIAAEIGVPAARFNEAVTRALRKRAGLTIEGQPRKNGRTPRLIISPAAAALAQRGVGEVSPSPAPIDELNVAATPDKKTYLSPAARERFASRGSTLDHAKAEQARGEQRAIEEGRRDEIEIGGIKKP